MSEPLAVFLVVVFLVIVISWGGATNGRDDDEF